MKQSKRNRQTKALERLHKHLNGLQHCKDNRSPYTWAPRLDQTIMQTKLEIASLENKLQ